MKKMILVDTSDVGADYSAKAVQQLGFEPIFLVDLDEFQGDTINEVKQYQHFHADTHSVSDLLNVIQTNNIQNIEGVITALDSGIPFAIELAQQLNVRCMPPILSQLASKSYVAELIPEYSPKSYALSAEQLKQAQTQAYLKQYNQLLIKPAKASAGIGAKHFRSEDIASSLTDHIAQFPYDDWVVMEYIEGTLFSLEGFVNDNDVHYLGFTSRKNIGNTESYCEFPVDDSIPSQFQQSAKQAVKTLVQRSNYSNGYFHSEFLITDNGCYLIDANVGRIGGGPLVDMIAASYNIEPMEAMKHFILLTLFPEQKPTSPYQTEQVRPTCGINYGIPTESRLRAVHVDGFVQVRHTQLLDDNVLVPSMGANNFAWIGIISGVKSQVMSFVDSMEIQTDEGTFNPCY